MFYKEIPLFHGMKSSWLCASAFAFISPLATLIMYSRILSPTGNPITPVIKLSTNTPLYEKMKDIIDIDTGDIIAGKETIQQAGERILEYIIKWRAEK